MMASEVFQQVRVIDPSSQTDRVADVWIADGMIQAMDDRIDSIPTGAAIQSGQGLILGPGLVDLYSHSGEPGFESRETLLSLTQAAQTGGFTRLTLLPDTQPPLDTLAGFKLVRTAYQAVQESAADPLPQLNFWGAMTLKHQADQLVELTELATAAAGLMHHQSLQNLALLRRVLEYLKPLNRPLALSPCDPNLRGDGVAREGMDGVQLGLPGDPAMSETAALAALLECVAEIGTPVHIMRVSTARGVELIQSAKAQGLPITASVSWHHVVLSTADLHSYDPHLRLDPPLGNPADQAAIRDGLKEGILDAIAIDHTPYTYEEKMVGFSETPPGAIGLELALPLLWQCLVETEHWSPLDLWRCLSLHPAQCLQQTAPTLKVGTAAECIVFDPKDAWSVSPQTLKSLAANTHWLNQTVQGRVKRIWCPQR